MALVSKLESTAYYYKYATEYFKLEWTKEFPCPHLNRFAKDQNKESKFLNLFGVEERKLKKDSKKFKENYDNEEKDDEIPAEKMDPEVISSFIVSKVKEKTSSKTEKRDSKKPCTSSALTKMETDEKIMTTKKRTLFKNTTLYPAEIQLKIYIIYI